MGNCYSLCTSSVDDSHILTWALQFAPAGTTTWASSGGWYYPALACHTFEQAFITFGPWQAAIKHKAPRQEAHLVAANVIIPNHSPHRCKQSQSWFAGPLTNQENSRGGIHYSVSPLETPWLQHNLCGLTHRLKLEDLKALAQSTAVPQLDLGCSESTSAPSSVRT